MIEPMLSSLTAESLYPQEKLEVSPVGKNLLQIGMPKENRAFEKRLPLTPEAVAILASQGHHVLVETGAGESIQYSDHDYSEAGAEIADRERVWASDIVMKIAPPTAEEVALMRQNAILFSFLQLKLLSAGCLDCIAEKHIYAIAYDFITDDFGDSPIKNQIREIEGRAAVMIAANLLTSELGGKGILLGSCAGVSPTEVVIIGASRDGIEAARAAKALGALVKVFDNRIDALRNMLHQLGCDTFTSTMHPNVLRNSLRTADVVIGTCRVEKKDEKPFLITSDLIMTMKKGALIIDLGVDMGGCFETSLCPQSAKDSYYIRYGVRHYCIPNISSRVGRTTTISLSNHILPILLQMADSTSINAFIRDNAPIRNGVYFYNGKLVNATVGEYFSCPWTDIMLFLTSFQ